MIQAPPAYPLWFAGRLLPFEAGVTHFFFAGTSGSGKTTEIRLLLQSFAPYIGQPGFDYEQKMVGFDPKQELLSILFGMGVAPEKIILLNPFDRRSAKWDLARDIRTEAAAIQFAVTIAPETNDTNRFFTDAARDIIVGAIVALNHLAPLKWDLRDLIQSLSKKRNLIALFSSCAYVEDRLDYFEESKTAANIMATIRTIIAPYRTIAACWHHADESVSLADWVEDKQGSFLILGYNTRVREALSAINRIVIQRLVELNLALEESETRRIYYVLDEARFLSDVEKSLSDLLTNGRSKGACAILGFQEIDGLRAVYGKEVTNEILAMCSSQAYLRFSSGSSAQWASDQFSFLYQDVSSTSVTTSTSSGPQGVTTSESTTTQTKQEKRERIAPGEFLSMRIANDKNGIPGAYISSWFKEGTPSVTTFLVKTLTPEESFGKLKRKSSKKDNFIPRDEAHEKLEPWNQDDLDRLNLQIRTASTDEGDLKSQFT